MRTLHAFYLKYVTADGDLSAATEHKLFDDTLTISAEGVLVERILSNNPNPKDRIEIGSKYTLKCMLGDSALDQLTAVFGGAVTSNVFTKNQGIRTLAGYDIEVGVKRPSDGATIKITLTDMNFIPNFEEVFKQGDNQYLPVELQSTSETTYSMDNSAT